VSDRPKRPPKHIIDGTEQVVSDRTMRAGMVGESTRKRKKTPVHEEDGDPMEFEKEPMIDESCSASFSADPGSLSMMGMGTNSPGWEEDTTIVLAVDKSDMRQEITEKSKKRVSPIKRNPVDYGSSKKKKNVGKDKEATSAMTGERRQLTLNDTVEEVNYFVFNKR
jgi:hypothetical protein